MLKRIMVWGAALAAIVAALLAIRMGPDVIDVLEQAPLPLPTGPRKTLDELQEQIRLPQEPVGEQSTAEPPNVASDEPPLAAAPDGSRRFMFDCGSGVIFGVRTVPGEATVFSPQILGADSLTLPQTEVASGARYAAGASVFWSRGGVATFEVRGQSFVDCTSNPGAARSAESRSRGATFRALGNEPPWVLEISQQQLTLTTELGARRTEFPHRDPVVAGARTTYRSFAGTQELVVAIDRAPCNDTMSGELFDNTVVVTLERTTLYGCGRNL
jgi:putative lipoprotein